jgi:hypothetical protein
MPLDGDSALAQMTPSATCRQYRRHIGSVEARGTEANFVEPARRAFPDDADAQSGSHQFSLPRFVDDLGTSLCRSHSHSRHRPPVAATNPQPSQLMVPGMQARRRRPSPRSLARPSTGVLEPEHLPARCLYEPITSIHSGRTRARNSFQRIDALDYLFRVPRKPL